MSVICIVVLVVLVVLAFIYGILHDVGRCCSDCVNYKVCYGNSLDRNHLEAPACDKFKERK